MDKIVNGHRQILIALDDSEGSWKALDHVAGRARTLTDPVIHLFHATDPIPPQLREFGGAENPHAERALERELKEKQERWAQTALAKTEPLLDQARHRIERAGIKQEKIYSHILVLRHREDLVDEILKVAEENHCESIVVGFSSFPWVKEVFVDHLGEELRRKARAIAVEIID